MPFGLRARVASFGKEEGYRVKNLMLQSFPDRDTSDNFVAYCCLPSGCPHLRKDPISVLDPRDAIKVSCSDTKCVIGAAWMHADCFQEWENDVLDVLCASGRSKGWSEQQKRLNATIEKKYDLVDKVRTCKCGNGYLSRDFHLTVNGVEGRQSKQKERELQGIPIQTDASKAYSRIHRSSLGSCGSSPSSSLGTPPSGSEDGCFNQCRQSVGFFVNEHQAATGNIFANRTNMSAFNFIPPKLRNAYNIRMEDDGPHGTDGTRSFVLKTLSVRSITSVACVVCQSQLIVYDKYPLIDGTFFLSPQPYFSGIAVIRENRRQYLDAVCVECMKGVKGAICCRCCGQKWEGSTLQIGSMYSYDVFAALPCCSARLACNNCGEMVRPFDDAGSLFYSDYSRSFICAHCHADDHHFAKPLNQIFSLGQ